MGLEHRLRAVVDIHGRPRCVWWRMRIHTPAAVAALLVLLLAVPLAACGGDDKSSSKSKQKQQKTTKGPVEPVAAINALSGRTTAVKLDKGFTKALKKLKVTPGVVGDARLTGGSVVFPITGGSVTAYKPGDVQPYVQGRIQHQGSGLSLKAGGKTVRLTNFVIDPGASLLTGDVSVNGKPAASATPLFFLDGSTLKPLKPTGYGAQLKGTTVKFKDESAKLLNQTFGVKDLAGGLKVGIATLKVAG